MSPKSVIDRLIAAAAGARSTAMTGRVMRSRLYLLLLVLMLAGAAAVALRRVVQRQGLSLGTRDMAALAVLLLFACLTSILVGITLRQTPVSDVRQRRLGLIEFVLGSFLTLGLGIAVGVAGCA